MKNTVKILAIMVGVFMYPFGCEAQVNGTLPGSDGCDTIIIDNPEHSQTVAELQRLQALTEQYLKEAGLLRDELSVVSIQLEEAEGSVTTLEASIKTLDLEVSALKSTNSALEASNSDLSSQLATISAENAAIVAGLENQIADRNATIEAQLVNMASLEQIEANLKAEKQTLISERDDLILISDVLRQEKATLETENGALASANTSLESENATLKEALEKKIDTVYTEVEVVVRDTVEMNELEIEGVVYSADRLKELLASDVRSEVIYNTCYREASKRSWLHVGSSEVYPHYIEIPFLEASLQPVQFDEKPHDFLTRYQLKYKLIKVQNHRDAKTVYKNTGEVPFQIFAKDSVVSAEAGSVVVRTFSSEHHGIKYYLNGELYNDFSDLSVANPGEANFEGYLVYRHTKKIDGLSPNTEYELRFVVNNAAGETDERTVTIKTTL